MASAAGMITKTLTAVGRRHASRADGDFDVLGDRFDAMYGTSWGRVRLAVLWDHMLTAIPEISLTQLVSAIFNVHGVGLDDIADFPAGHALRATVFYGLVAFCIARLSSDRRQGLTAYAVALVLIGSISLVRLYLGAHYPMDLLGGWMAGAALLSILVSVHVLTVDERVRREALAAPKVAAAARRRRVAVPLHDRKSGARAT